MDMLKNLKSETFFLTVGVFSVTALTNVIIYNGVKKIINRNKIIEHVNSDNSIDSLNTKDEFEDSVENNVENNIKNNENIKNNKKSTELKKCFIINNYKVIHDFTCFGCVVGTAITLYNAYKTK